MSVGSGPDAALAATATGPATFYITNSATGGSAVSYSFGNSSGDTPVVGAWTVPLRDVYGVYRQSESTFYLPISLGSSTVNSIHFGNVGDLPVVGDWTGAGITDVGVFRPSNHTFYLRASATTTITINFGASGDTPVAGDWNGDGIDSVGVYRAGTAIFYLSNMITSGSAPTDYTVHYGNSTGDLPIVGAWNGSALSLTASVGVYRTGTRTFYEAADNSSTPSTIRSFAFGNSGDTPLSGDWDGDLTTTAGLWRAHGDGSAPGLSCASDDHCWGVDSEGVSITDSNLSSIKSAYNGSAEFFGRYIDDNGNPLSSGEVSTAQSNSIAILVISNHGGGAIDVQSASAGSAQGSAAAQKLANLKAPKGKIAIFADIESGSNPTASYMKAYADAVASGGYRAGFYLSEADGNSAQAFCSAASDTNVANAVVWSSSPDDDGTKSKGRSTKPGAPAFAADATNCASGTTAAWQYGIPSTDNSSTPSSVHNGPNVDNDEVKAGDLSFLWLPGQ